MSRSRISTTVTVDAEVDISEFDDDVVLEAAIQAVMEHKGRKSSGHRAKEWEATQAVVERLAAVLGLTELAPRSTAAGVTSLAHLHAICGKVAP